MLALEERSVFDLHLDTDLGLHSVKKYNNDIVRGYNFGVSSTI